MKELTTLKMGLIALTLCTLGTIHSKAAHASYTFTNTSFNIIANQAEVRGLMTATGTYVSEIRIKGNGAGNQIIVGNSSFSLSESKITVPSSVLSPSCVSLLAQVQATNVMLRSTNVNPASLYPGVRIVITGATGSQSVSSPYWWSITSGTGIYCTVNSAP